MRLPELLAPAGSPEAARAAVQNGADAIYLGGKQFSARQYADNFGDEDIEEVIRYCHIYGVKVYVTVNTLVHNQEMEKALEYLRFLYNADADAVIMQDIGLIRSAEELLPGLTIHGSTQMTIHNSPGIELLEELGVKRIVLAREMSLEEIRRVKEKTHMELEVFIHGALCVGYSGQCLFSSMIGGRSGNRGRCAQPCRLPYSLLEVEGTSQETGGYSHLLSPKDLNLIEQLPSLVEAGVAGLKIEGRMKRPEYVAVVTKVYRQALDRYAKDPGAFKVTPEEKYELAQVFNREFTTGYLFGNQGQALMSPDRSNNRGTFLGRVQKTDRETGRITIQTDTDLSIGDEIEFWVTSGGRKEVKVHRIYKENMAVDGVPAGETVQIEVPSSGGIHPGDRVFKTYDTHLISEAKRSYSSSLRKRKIPLKLLVRLYPGEPMVLTGEDDLGNYVSVSSEMAAEKARKRPLTEESVRQQLDRMGNTPFQLERLEFDLAPQVIIPLSEINRCRRKLVEDFEEKRSFNGGIRQIPEKKFKIPLAKVLNKCPGAPAEKEKGQVISVSAGDTESAHAAIEKGARRIYLGGEIFQGKNISRQDMESLVRLGEKTNTEVYIALPRIFQENELEEVKQKVEDTLGVKPAGYACGNLGALQLLSSLGVEGIHADYPLNIFNRQSACYCLDKGAGTYTLSMELNMQEIGRFGLRLQEAECVVHGWPPLMVSRHCVLDTKELGGNSACLGRCRKSAVGLKDRMNLVFPVKMDTRCRMYLFNSKELCLIENLVQLAALGVGYFRIEAKTEGPRYVERVVSEYGNVMKMISAGHSSQEAAAAARERLEKFSPQGITKGHYFRGV